MRRRPFTSTWRSWCLSAVVRREAVELLEASSRAALADGDVHLALLLGLGAVECDPLRESANLLAVRIRMIEGDRVGAIRHARTYARTLHDEIGIAPPEPLADLLALHRRPGKESLVSP